jgi:hypothetical protein
LELEQGCAVLPIRLSRLFRKSEREHPATGDLSALDAAQKSPEAAVTAALAKPASTPAADEPEYLKAETVDEVLRIEEVANAEFFVGDLFRRRFRGDPPDYPKHFVAFYRPERSTLQAVGYVHYTQFEDSWLCGGLVIDDRLYRRMPSAHRDLIRHAGGIAEKLLRDTFARLADAPAIWGYVGDALAEKVDLRAGFRHTKDRYVMVCWNKDLPEDEKAQRLARVVALGPF